MGLRRAGRGDEAALRAARIRAIGAEPQWFGSTVEREEARTTEDWWSWFEPGATFVVDDGRHDVIGILAVLRPDGEPDVGQLASMWVAPEGRGLGVADALVDQALRFAADEGATVARLHVYETNERARRLYGRHGFVATGRRLEPDRLGRVDIELVRPLGGDHGAPPPPGRARPVTSEDVLAVTDGLRAAGVEHWLDGGWAVDALLGEQTRPHADLDLAVPLALQADYVRAMQAAGFTTVRVDQAANPVMADPHGRHVDAHLVDIGCTTRRDDGVEVHGPAGIAYEVGAFGATGSIDGRAVPCCTPAFLVRAHTGYEIDADDVHDVVALCERFGIPLPDQHARFLAGRDGRAADEATGPTGQPR